MKSPFLCTRPGETCEYSIDERDETFKVNSSTGAGSGKEPATYAGGDRMIDTEWKRRVVKSGKVICSFSAMFLGAYLGSQIGQLWKLEKIHYENERCLQEMNVMLQEYVETNNSIVETYNLQIEASTLQVELEQELWEAVYPQIELLMSDLQEVSEELQYFQQFVEANDSSD